MCRVCGSMVRCLYDIGSMPSRTLPRPVLNTRTLFRTPVQPVQLPIRSISTSKPHAEPSARPQRRPQPSPYSPYLRRNLQKAPVLEAEASYDPLRPAENTNDLPPSILTTLDASEITADEQQQTSQVTFRPHNNKPLVLSKSLQELLPALSAQTPHYITAHIHSFPYLLTEGDVLRLPTTLGLDLQPGTILRLNRASILGSKDYTLKAGTSDPQHSSPPHIRGESFTNKKRTGETNYIDDRLFECRVRVMGVDSGPMMIKQKKKRRNRHLKEARSKHKYTVLRVMQVKVNSLQEVMELKDENQIVLE